MELISTAEDIIKIVPICFQTGNSSPLVNSLDRENPENLDTILLKINENLSDYGRHLSGSESLISNGLHILMDLIFKFKKFVNLKEDLCLSLARSVLFVIIDEDCNITNIKRGITILNLLFQNPLVISTVVADETLEGALQILGRKLPSIGDYECQALLYEALYRITTHENRDYWASVWFTDFTARKMFLSLDPKKFELNCRKALNYINRNEVERRVFSVIANKISFSSFQLDKPCDCDFWVDFNYGSESISFYCSDLCTTDSLNDSGQWETIVIPNTSVNAFYIKEDKAEKVKEVTLILNCPCHNLITSSHNANPALNSYEIKLSFWSLLDIYKHFEMIFGIDKYIKVSLTGNLKISDCTVAIEIETAENYTNDQAIMFLNDLPKRKVSDSSPIPLNQFPVENENVIPETERTHIFARISDSSEVIGINPENIIPETQKIMIARISESSEVIGIQPEEIQTLNNYRMDHAKKIYNSEVIHVTPESDAIENANLPQEHTLNEITSERKVSQSSFNIKVANYHDEEDYQYEEILNSGKRKRKLTKSQRVKSAKLRTKSTSSENISRDVLMSGITDETEINVEAQSNSKYSTKKIRRKSPISSSAHISRIDFQTANENTISKDSYSTRNCHAKENICIVDDKTAKELGDSDGKNSAASGILADVSMIDDSQTKKHKLVGNTVLYPMNNLNMPSSETMELSTALNERVRKRKSSMVSNENNESQATHEKLSQSSKGMRESENVAEKQFKKISSSQKQLEHTPKISSGSEKEPRKIRLSLEEFGESSKETISSESVPKNGRKKMRLYNLDNAPVYDVPPSKSLQKSTSPKEGQTKPPVFDLNAISEDDSGGNIEPISDRRKDSNVSKDIDEGVSKDEKMKVYDLIHHSDEDFEAQKSRIFSSRKKKCKRLSSYRGVPSKKKKNEISQIDENNKSTRPTREAAAKAMKVNKRIFDQASEVAYHEIQVLSESDNSGSPVGKSVKRGKYSKVFTPLKSDTETGSSEVSWLKQKSCPLFESPKRNYSHRKKNQQNKKSLPAKAVPKKKKNVISIETGSKSKTMTWSDFESFNLAIEKSKSNRNSALKSLEDELRDLSTVALNKSASNKDSSPNQTEQISSLINNIVSKDGSEENDLVEDYHEPNIDYGNACDNIQNNNSTERHNDDTTAYHEDVHEMKINKKQKHNLNKYTASDDYNNIEDTNSKERHNYKPNNKLVSDKKIYEVKRNRKQKYPLDNYAASDECDNIKDANFKETESYEEKNDNSDYNKDVLKMKRNRKHTPDNSISSDEVAALQSTILPPQSAESNDSLHKNDGSDPIQSLQPDECVSEFVTDKNIPPTVMELRNETIGKKFLLKRFLKCAVKCSESSQNSLSLSTYDPGVQNSKDNSVSAANHESESKKDTRSKTNESSVSWTRQKNEKPQPLPNDSFKRPLAKDLITENLKDYSQDDLSLRNSLDRVHHENSVNGKSFEIVDNKKRKKISSASKRGENETPLKRSKLHHSLPDMKNCTLDSLSLRYRSEPGDKEAQISMDNHTFGKKRNRKNFDSVNEELNRSTSLTKKTKLKSSSVLGNSLHSELTTVSFKEVECDGSWFNKITQSLSQDSDVLTKRLLATVQKCFCDYSAKMFCLRENMRKATEAFEMSSSRNIKASKLKNLIQTCKVIRAEVEESLKEMKETGKKYFEAEERYYRKQRLKYIKACKKYLLSMKSAQDNAVHKLEANVLLKAKYFFRKFMKYIDTA